MPPDPSPTQDSTLPTFYSGWQNYQSLLTTAIAPLTADQLALKAAPHLRSVHDIATHIIGARSRWLRDLDEDPSFLTFTFFAPWDRPGSPTRSAAELVAALNSTWQVFHAALLRWTPADFAQTYPGEPPDEPETISRAWIIWHLIEHDLHHGGEISLTLGLHNLPAPGL